MDYDKLLDAWAEKVFVEADKAMKLHEERENPDFKSGYQKGYSDGLRMATAILTRMEKIEKHKVAK